MISFQNSNLFFFKKMAKTVGSLAIFKEEIAKMQNKVLK